MSDVNDPPSPSDWAQLWDRQESQNRVFFVAQDQQAKQIAELAHGQDSVLRRTERVETELKGIRAAVEENTELTRGIRDAITAGRVASVAIKWLAGAIVTIATTWVAVKGLWKDGP